MSELALALEPVPEELLRDGRLGIQFVDGTTGQGLTGEISVKMDNPYRIDLSPFIPQTECYSLEDFCDTLQEVLADIQNRQGIVPEQHLQVMQEYPYEPLPFQGDSVITFKVLSREPAKMDAKGTGRPQRGWGASYQMTTADDPNKVILIESRPIEHMIELSVWSKTATIANDKALWLERNLIRESWAFKIKGISRFVWMGRGMDTVWTPGTRLHQRPLKFKVVLHELMPRAHNQIKDIVFTVRNKLI